MSDALLPTYARADIAFDRGAGAYLYTQDGRRFLDFGAGVAVVSLGHCHPHVVKALKDQADKLWHTSNLYRIPGQERLASRLVAASFADRVFFCNSGAEAMELSIKAARKYHHHAGNPQRNRIIGFHHSFHGRTLSTLAAAGEAKYLEGFGPVPDGFDHVPFGDFAALKAAVGPQTAGILLEPVQGEGGMRAFPDDFLRAVRQLCDEAGILMMLDEVQCGMGRTGKLFAHEWAGITPDILGAAKGIGGGFPLGACLLTERAAAGMVAGTHGSTYGGNPLAMAVGNAVLDIVGDPDFLAQVRRVGAVFQEKLTALANRHGNGVIAEVRGKGLMMGLKTRVPNTEVVKALRDKGLLAVGAGDNVVRLLPPLIIEESHIDEAIGMMDAAFSDLKETAS